MIADFRIRVLTCFFTGILLTLDLSAQELRWWPSFGSAVKVDRVSIQTEEDVTLTGQLFYRQDRREPAPAIVLICPWAVGHSVYEVRAKELARRGFVVLTYNTRGWWGSGGNIDIAGPRDVADARHVIDWLIENPRVDPDRIGMGGISLGGGTTLLAAAYDPRIRVVAVFSSWSDLMTSFFGNNTRRVLWQFILEASARFGIKKLPPEGLMAEQKAQILKKDVEGLRTYTDPRSPLRLIDRYNENQTAIFISHNYSDFLFPANDIWTFYQRLETPKRLRMQAGIHASSEFMEMKQPTSGPIWADAEAWFDRWLMPDRTRVAHLADMHIKLALDEPDLEFKSENPPTVQTYRFYMQRYPEPTRRGFGRLVSHKSNMNCCRTLQSGLYSGVYTGLPLVHAFADSIIPLETGMRSSRIDLSKAAVYSLPPAHRPTRLIGVPEIRLKVEADAEQLHLIAYLFKLTPRGQWKVVSIAPYTLFDLELETPRIINFPLFGGFTRVDPGERLVLAFDTHESEFSPPLDSVPATFRIYTDGSSFIDLPFLDAGAEDFFEEPLGPEVILE